MTPIATATTESRLSIPVYMRQQMWVSPSADAERSDRKADMALQTAEASKRRGFMQGAESAHRRALAFVESLPMALRVADSAIAYGFSHLAAEALTMAATLAKSMPDARFVLSQAQQHQFPQVVVQACVRLVEIAQKVDEAVSAAETAHAAGLPEVVRTALEKAETLCFLPHERRQVERCALHLGVAA